MKKRKRNLKSKKDFSFKQEYKESWGYLKKSQNFIYIIIAIFLLFALLGFFIPIPESLSNQIFEFIRELLEQTKNMGQGELTSFIFFNNFSPCKWVSYRICGFNCNSRSRVFCFMEVNSSWNF